MTTASAVQSSSDTRARSWYRLAWWCGIAFVPVFVVGFIAIAGTPDGTDSDKKWIDWYADSGNRTGQVVGIYLLTVAAVLFLVFSSGIVDRLRGSVGLASSAARGTAIAFAISVMIGAVNFGGVGANIQIGDVPVPKDADILRQNFGYGFFGVSSAIAAAAFIAIVTTIARQVGEIGSGLVWTGYVLAVIELAGVIFFPMAALPIWVLVMAITFLRRPV